MHPRAHASLLGFIILGIAALILGVSSAWPLLGKPQAGTGPAASTTPNPDTGPLPQAADPASISWLSADDVMTIEQVAADPKRYDRADVSLATTLIFLPGMAYLEDAPGGTPLGLNAFVDKDARKNSDVFAYVRNKDAEARIPVYVRGTVLTSGGPYTTGSGEVPYGIDVADMRLR